MSLTQVGNSTRRVAWIDYARGMAIILVVFSHVIGSLETLDRVSLSGLPAYLSYSAYTFHVPVFFVLSGIFAARQLARNREAFWIGKGVGLLVPYIVWSLAYVAIALLFHGSVNRAIGPSMLYRIFWNPYLHFWFLYALMLAHAIAYLLAPFGRAAVLGCSVIMYACSLLLQPEGIIQAETHFFIYYACGFALADVQPLATGSFSRIAVAFTLLVPATALPFAEGFSYQALTCLPATVMGVVLVFQIAHWLGKSDDLPLLRMIGRCSMPIYILHVFFDSATRIALDHLGAGGVVAQIVVGTFIGVTGPMLLYFLLHRSGLISFAALGGPKQQ